MFGGGATTRCARQAARWVRSHPDLSAIVLLTLLATGLFAIPAMTGSLVLPGDNLFQNEPLRVLTGNILRTGRLPAWDPLIWSGTPLLAGWNAGSMFPGTWLFVFLPAGLAWTLNLVVAYLACSVGTHLLLRRIGVAPFAAMLSALVFSYTGFMNGQLVHIGLVQGTAFTPWLLLGIEWIVDGTGLRGRARGVALVGAASALTVLAGDPRAPTSAAVIAVVWIVARLIHGIVRPIVTSAWIVAGGALGIALSAIQWIPGIGFLHTSQRANAAFSFFSAGSLDVKSLVTKTLVPFIIGGNGNFGLPTYVGGYNLPEVTIGAGLVALVAMGAFVPTAVRSISTWLRHRTTLGGYRLGTAYALVVVGTILTMGGRTVFGHLLVHLPLYGGERLQNRNAAIFDIGLALFVAFFVDDALRRRSAAADVDVADAPATPDRRRVLGNWPSIVLGVVPPLAAVTLIVVAYADPLGLGHRLGISAVRPALFKGLAPYLTPTMILAALLAVFVVVAHRLPRILRAIAVICFVTIDIATYLTGIGIASVPTTVVAASNPASTAVAKLAGPNGRSAIYNAAFESIGDDPYAPEEFGVTDVNLLRDLSSVQGYGSIVNSGYETETNTHSFEDLDVGSLNGQTFDDLNLRTLLTLPAYLDVAIPGGTTPAIALGNRHFTSGPHVSIPPPLAGGPYPISTTRPATFFLATPWHVRTVTIYLNGAAVAPQILKIVARGPKGAPQVRQARVVDGRVTVKLPANFEATEFDVSEVRGGPGSIGAVLVVTRFPGERLLLDGILQDQLIPPHWTYAGTVGPLTAFVNHDAKGAAWVVPPAGKSAAGDAVRVISTSAIAPTEMSVDAPSGGTLVRSEEYAHGWTARLHPIGGGPTTVLPVVQDGLIQKVTIPPGRYTVTWKYAPAGVLAGFVLTVIGFLIFLVLGLVSTRRRTGRSTPTA